MDLFILNSIIFDIVCITDEQYLFLSQAPAQEKSPDKNELKKRIAELDKTIRQLKAEGEEKDQQLRRLQRAVNSGAHMQVKYKRAQAENFKLRTRVQNLSKSPYSRLSDDQHLALTRSSTRGMKWSPQTIRAGLIKWMRCGT
jgi:predicted RNase H-like nuclease (RuvC/YqgF family)